MMPGEGTTPGERDGVWKGEMMPGEGDSARRGQYKKGTMQGEGDSARRKGWCQEKGTM